MFTWRWLSPICPKVADGIGTIVFDNPEKHNAMTGDMLAALSRVTNAFAEDPDVLDPTLARTYVGRINEKRRPDGPP